MKAFIVLPVQKIGECLIEIIEVKRGLLSPLIAKTMLVLKVIDSKTLQFLNAFYTLEQFSVPLANLNMPKLSILDRFSETEINPLWSFDDHRSTDTYTHGYHRYPAKFVPQLVKKLIKHQTKRTDIIADVFAGCGTTLVESKLNGRSSIGVDINPVAQIITRAKITPIDGTKAQKKFDDILTCIANYRHRKDQIIKKHPRIDYWFGKREKHKIAYLYSLILKINNSELRIFFLCGLSNILKSSSRWLQTSTKPQIDHDKKPIDPFIAFEKQIHHMLKRNDDFYTQLEKKDLLEIPSNIIHGDARNTKLPARSINVIITSPPYVTSYEYADIHQLTGYWFEYISEIVPFRKNFIGTFYSNNKNEANHNKTAQSIIDSLRLKDKKKAKEVANYFSDMFIVAKEMKRILKKNGKACVVIGNTTLRDVKIKSAEVFAEFLVEQNFSIVSIIKRKIPVKLIPTIRDKNSGRFTTLSNKNKKLVYPEEYIIIAKKNE